MRKFPLIAALVIVIGGSAYALVSNLFPDTVSLPRIPTTPGTIGHTIATLLGVSDLGSYAGNGSVANSEKLGGVSGSGFLKHKRCGGINVWLGVGPDGMPICGRGGALLTYEIGTLTGVTGAVTILKTDGTSSAGTNGTTLYNGDIISTAGSSSGTIAFSDSSIIRLNELSTVELQVGENEDGEAIAQIILNNGDLWGRVLTNTGMNVGAGGYIAGVRGTSVAVQKSGNNVTITIVDSTNSSNNAVKVYYEGQEATGENVGTGTQISVQSGTYLADIPVATPGKVAIFTDNEWARRNTLQDMQYMLTLQNTSLELERMEKVKNEFEVTTPKIEDTVLCRALGGTEVSCSADDENEYLPNALRSVEGQNLTVAQIEGRQKLKALRMLCANNYGGVYWRTLGQCLVPEAVAGGGSSPRTTHLFANYIDEPYATYITNTGRITLPVFSEIIDDPITGRPGVTTANFSNPLLSAGNDLKGPNRVIKPAYDMPYTLGTIKDDENLKKGNWGMELTTIGENKYGKWNLQALLNNADFIRENIQYGNAVDIKDMVTNWIQQG